MWEWFWNKWQNAYKHLIFTKLYLCRFWRESISYRFSLIFDILNFALEIHWRYSLQSRRKKVEMKRSDTSEVNINKKFIWAASYTAQFARKEKFQSEKLKHTQFHTF